MGQQQLLLLVLGIVIVGLMVAIAINAFSEKQIHSDFDAITAEAIKIAGDVISWKFTPSSLGGGSNATNLTGLTFDAMGYQSSGPSQTRANTSTYMRSINQLDSARPYIIVRPQNNRDLRVQLFMYGPNQNCFRLSRAVRTEGGWEEGNMDSDLDQAPPGCSGW
ncbi:MAG: hypothetical protein HKN43_17360 [Rhodothermales bacterium]|nr:hypothetical protein [Rhodothermales bacterium]